MTSSYDWVKCENFQIPSDAFKCGTDADDNDIYVGRTPFRQGDKLAELPVKIVPSRREAYVSSEGKEYKVDKFEVLCPGTFQWKPSHNGGIPAGTIPTGQTSTNEPLYFGRVQVDNATLVGRIQCSDECLYAPYDGKEVKYTHSEVLTIRR